MTQKKGSPYTVNKVTEVQPFVEEGCRPIPKIAHGQSFMRMEGFSG